METVLRYWNKVPVLVRAVGGGFVVMVAGSMLSMAPLAANLRFGSRIPWSFPIVLFILWLFWRYASGSGPPASFQARRSWLCRTDISARMAWAPLVVFMISALAAIIGFRLLMPNIMEVSPLGSGIDVSLLPTWTGLALMFSVAVSAGVTEEVAFRGYMQRPLEEQLGLLPAALIVGLAFWIAHLNHDQLTVTHLPFHMMGSLLFGYLVYVTRSLVPAIFLHVVVDVLALPAYSFRKPALVWDLLMTKPAWQTGRWGAVLVLSTLVVVSLLVAAGSLYRMLRNRREEGQNG